MKAKFVLLAVSATAALTATPASAHTCNAVASPPAFSGGAATGLGSHSCETSRTTISVTVCLEVAKLQGLWSSYGCRTYSNSGPIAFGTATYNVCSVPGGILVRTTAYGQTGRGENDYDESIPKPYACAAGAR